MPESTAIVLGGSAGVGHAVVRALLDRGHRVGVVARGAARLDRMAEEFGDRIAVAPADVADAEALETAVDDLISALGKPAIWVNSAMLTSFSPFEKVDAREFQRIVDVTLIGQVNGTRLALRHMTRGNIVNVGSGLGYRPVPYQAAYCASKHAINGFTSSVRSELIRDGRPIALSLVQLPAIDTPQFDWAMNRLGSKPQPAPPIFSPKVAARAVLRAIDKDARELFVGSSVLKLVFGNFVLPDWLDRKLSRDGAEMQKSDRPEPGDRPNNLYTPVDYAPSSTGSFGDRASEDGVIVDGDLARKVAVGGVLGVGIVIGLLLALLFD